MFLSSKGLLTQSAMVGAVVVALACTEGRKPVDGQDLSICSGNCDMNCRDTATNPQHCGGCGLACETGDICCAGTCIQGSSSCDVSITAIGHVVPLAVHPNSSVGALAAGWQNGGDFLKITGSGFGAPLRAQIGSSVAPATVIDSNTILLQTPPGTVGAKDVRLAFGVTTAVRLRGFSYEQGRIQTEWVEKAMANVRGDFPAISVLQDGRVLIAGGSLTPLQVMETTDSAELYDPDTNQTTPTKNFLSSPRWFASAVTLLDGRVLVTGGACGAEGTSCKGGSQLAARADLFDPETNQFQQTTSVMNKPRVFTRNVLLADGRVLVASSNDASLELFDPASGAFTLLPRDSPAKLGVALVRLLDGRVLFVGGEFTFIQNGSVPVASKTAEIFDPVTAQFEGLPDMKVARSNMTAELLPDGKVVIFGGLRGRAGHLENATDTIEWFDPSTKDFTLLPAKLGSIRAYHASALVSDGTVLIMGGYTPTDMKPCQFTGKTDQFHPETASITLFGDLPKPITAWRAVTLLDGSVLGAGGGACSQFTASPILNFLNGNIIQ